MTPTPTDPRSLEELARDGAAAKALSALKAAGGDRVGPMEGHCLRCYLICLELGRRNGWALDEEILLVAAILHDAGLYPAVSGDPAVSSADGVYVREGAELAEGIVKEFGWSAERTRICMDAIECHHELRGQLDRGAEVEALRRADMVEVSAGLVSFGIPRDWFSDLRRQVPADGMYREIGRLVGGVLRQRPATLPRIFLR